MTGDTVVEGAAADRVATPGRTEPGGTDVRAPAQGEPGSDGAAPARHLVAVPSSGSRGKRARRLRWAAPVGIAAGVIAFLGFGIQQFGGSQADRATSAAGSAADDSTFSAGAETLALSGGIVQVSETGIDYRRDTLSQVGVSELAGSVPQAGARASGFRHAPDEAHQPAKAEAGLARLRVQQALQACIDAIAAEHGAGEITPQSVDFAQFEGAAAVIVQFTAAGATWVWAAGPECGLAGVGAAKLDAVKVG
jgi:hypothetical protein